jgi:NAD(P)-dependent dehydrogenase (short-subunit alcohol dehydrogenase family)
LITGGGSGLGAAVARHLAGLGWTVAVAGRRLPQLQEVAAATGAAVYALDVADAAAVERAVRHFNPDALVCAAGFLRQASVYDALTSQAYMETLAINAGGTFNACSSVMRLWREQGRPGDIVNVSSLGAIRGLQKFPGFAAYASSKHAVVGLTEALALEGKAHGIRVNSLAPGTMRTPMMASMGLTPGTLPESIAPSVEFLLDRTRCGPMTGTTVEIHCNDD